MIQLVRIMIPDTMLRNQTVTDRDFSSFSHVAK